MTDLLILRFISAFLLFVVAGLAVSVESKQGKRCGPYFWLGFCLACIGVVILLYIPRLSGLGHG